MDYLNRQTAEQIENVMGMKIKTIPETILNQFQREESIKALKQ